MPFLWATCPASLAALAEGSVVLHKLALSALVGMFQYYLQKNIKKKSGRETLKLCEVTLNRQY